MSFDSQREAFDRIVAAINRPCGIPVLCQIRYRLLFWRLRLFRSFNVWKTLAEIFTLNPDPWVQNYIRKLFLKTPKENPHYLSYHRAIKYRNRVWSICDTWAHTRHHGLAEIIKTKGWTLKDDNRLYPLLTLLQGKGSNLNRAGERIVLNLLNLYENNDPQFADQAKAVLLKLTREDARQKLYNLAISGDHPRAVELVIEAGFLPKDSYQQALFFFLTERWEKYEALDFDGRLLRTMFDAASPAMRQKITGKIRKAGKARFLSILAGRDFRTRLDKMNDDEFKVFVRVLADQAEWERLWQLVFEVPFFWSINIIDILSKGAWRPAAADAQQFFQRLSELAYQPMVVSATEIKEILKPAVRKAQINVPGRINDIAFSPQVPEVAIGTATRKVAIWNYERGELTRVLRGFQRSIGRVTYTSGGLLACVERTNKSTSICSLYVAEGENVQQVGHHTGSITDILPLPENHFFTTGRDGIVVLWDAASRQQLNQRQFSFWPRAACVSRDGHYAALLYKNLALLKIPSLDLVAELTEPVKEPIFRCGDFSPDGQAIITGKSNWKVQLIRIGKYGMVDTPGLFQRHRSGLQRIRSIHRNGVVLSATANGEVAFKLWKNNLDLGRITMKGQQLNAVHISPDGAFMALGNSDASMTFWDIRNLDIPMLLNEAFMRSTPAHLGSVKRLRRNKALPLKVKNALKYIETILQFRFRYAIEISPVREMKAGAFDIIID